MQHCAAYILCLQFLSFHHFTGVRHKKAEIIMASDEPGLLGLHVQSCPLALGDQYHCVLAQVTMPHSIR